MARRRLRLLWMSGLLVMLGVYGIAARPLGHDPQFARWSKLAEPVLAPEVSSWEHGAIGEPVVIREGDVYHMWYSGGWEAAAIGHATSTDGVHWTRFADNPVLGQGRGGVSGDAVRPEVVLDDGTFYLFFVEGVTGYGDRLHVASSHDGIHFDVFPQPLLEPDSWDLGIANTAVWHANDGWHMLYEARADDGVWRIGTARGISPFTWTKVSGPLEDLSVSRLHNGAYGGPFVLPFGDTLHLWYHAGDVGMLPTDIYHAVSRDGLRWEHSGDGLVVRRSLEREVDQVADPWLVSTPDGVLLYYTYVDNPRAAGGVAAARFDGTLAELLSAS